MAVKSYPMSTADVTWLRMEAPTNPFTISGVLLLGETMDIETMRRMVSNRLLVFERFKQRVKGRHATPRWEKDPHFHIEKHVHEVALPNPGGKAELQALASDLLSTPLDFGKPPWEMHLVQNVDGASAIIGRIHHVYGDGIALIHVLLSMTDEYFDPERGSKPGGKGKPSPLTALFKPAMQAAGATAKVAGTVVGDTVKMAVNPSHLFHRAKQAMSLGGTLSRLALLPEDSPTRFKGELNSLKRVAWSKEVSLDVVKRIGAANDSKVNDVLLTAVAGALRRYLTAQGDPTDDVQIGAAVPVNVRPLEEAYKLGNYFGIVFLMLPVGVEDPRERLAILKARMDRIKVTPEALVMLGVLQTAGAAPRVLQDKLLDILSAKNSAVMTNVPGPREPLHFEGIEMTGMMFWVPCSGSIGMGVSILSYAGGVRLGIATDRGVVEDPETLAALFDTEFEELAAEFA
ncbi:MAG: wax ester/triacylglycerol synthase family O-acyltransferase [Bacteroidota bacterium]